MAGRGAVSGSPVGWDVSELVARWPGLPSLPGDRGADACVVGLGASGLAAIDALVARGLSVIGVDAGRVAGAAAGRNGGFLIAGAEAGLHDAVTAWGAAAVELYHETLAEIDTLEATLPPGILRRQGSIRLAGLPGEAQDETEARERNREIADCAAQAAALREHGIPVEEYRGPLGTGLFLPLDAAVNPAERALAIAARLEHAAALFENTRVQRVQAGEVTTLHGVVRAPVIIVAVDGQLDRLIPRLASRVRTARLQMVATEPVAPRLPCPVYGRWGYDYAQQDAAGRLYVGGGRDLFGEQEWTTDSAPSDPVQGYLDGLAARMAGGPVTVRHRWAAPVGFTADERALCTRVDDGVIAVGGYSGTGNLVGPVAARAAVAYALDGVTPPSYFSS